MVNKKLKTGNPYRQAAPFPISNSYGRPFRKRTYLTAMLSISTSTPFGKVLTATAERAGKSPSK